MNFFDKLALAETGELHKYMNIQGVNYNRKFGNANLSVSCKIENKKYSLFLQINDEPAMKYLTDGDKSYKPATYLTEHTKDVHRIQAIYSAWESYTRSWFDLQIENAFLHFTMLDLEHYLYPTELDCLPGTTAPTEPLEIPPSEKNPYTF